MPELRVVWRMAQWWACAAVIAVAVFFGWVIREGLRSTSGEVWSHVLIPLYAVWLYVALATLVNRRSVTATPEHLTLKNGPIPIGNGWRQFARSDIDFTSFVPVVTVDDSGESVVLWYLTGIVTHAGKDVQVFREFGDAEAAMAAARSIADALGPGRDRQPMEVRAMNQFRDDPGERRLIFVWIAIVVVALGAGIVWELAYRWR